jgi:hypothetical protein
MKVIFGLLLAVSFCLGASAAPNIFGAGFMKTLADTVSGIAYQLVSTVRVVANVCACKAGQITDERAADFFNCYDKAPVSQALVYIKISKSNLKIYFKTTLAFTGWWTSDLHGLPNQSRWS